MHSLLKSILMGAALFTAVASFPAKAEIFVIEDDNDRFSLSFPDSWISVTNQTPDDKLTIVGQGENEFAQCRVRVRDERRHVIFPNKKFGEELQKLYVSRDFWKEYLANYDNVDIEFFKDESGLGYGHASMVEASFETTKGPLVRKRGIAFASLYHDQLYIVECSAERTVYEKWRPAFLGIIKSVDFEVVTHPDTQGHYRDFTGEEEKVDVVGPQELDEYKL